MNKPSRIGAGLALAFAAVLLAGCSSSDSDGSNPGNTPVTPVPTPPAPPPPAPPPPGPPPSASVDPTVALVRQLVAQGGNNTDEPLVLSNRPFATTDTTEPESI